MSKTYLMWKFDTDNLELEIQEATVACARRLGRDTDPVLPGVAFPQHQRRGPLGRVCCGEPCRKHERGQQGHRACAVRSRVHLGVLVLAAGLW